MNYRQLITEYLIANQSSIKKEYDELVKQKLEYLRVEHPYLREDINAQFEARIIQYISFLTADALSIPTEYVIIELERINLEKYLNV